MCGLLPNLEPRIQLALLEAMYLAHNCDMDVLVSTNIKSIVIILQCNFHFLFYPWCIFSRANSFAPECNISTSIGLTALKFWTNARGFQRINAPDVGVAPQEG